MENRYILVVEDEEDISELICYNLKKAGYEFETAFSGEIGLEKIKNKPPYLVLLDIMLPKINGFDVLRNIRSDEKYKNISVIMITAKSSDSDVVKGLELGADDYIAKPFSPAVLMARINSVLKRRSDFTKGNTIKIDRMFINPSKYEITIDDEPVNLTISEFQALCLLAEKRGWVMSRYQIINAIKGEDHFVTDRAVDVMIVGLRKKLKDYGKYIETVRGVGYKFKGG
jgi:two-component system phosphate regulon response regulator PhoB